MGLLRLIFLKAVHGSKWVRWVAGIALLLWGAWLMLWWLITTPANPMTVEELKQIIQRECPIGSSREQVVRFLDRYCTRHEGDRYPKDSEVGGFIEDTRRGDVFVEVGIQVIFYFDEHDRVVNYTVREVYTGL